MFRGFANSYCGIAIASGAHQERPGCIDAKLGQWRSQQVGMLVRVACELRGGAWFALHRATLALHAIGEGECCAKQEPEGVSISVRKGLVEPHHVTRYDESRRVDALFCAFLRRCIEQIDAVGRSASGEGDRRVSGGLEKHEELALPKVGVELLGDLDERDEVMHDVGHVVRAAKIQRPVDQAKQRVARAR